MQSNNFSRRAIGLLLGAALIGVAILDTVPLHAQDSAIKEQLQGVDLTGVKQLRLSPNGKLAAGLTGLYDNPGSRSRSFSLIKIWSIGKKELLHEFRVPGEAYEVVFTPDGSTVVIADRTGNLGYTTTIRAWDLAEGTEREAGTCSGEIDELRFSPDGSRLAAVADFGYFSIMSARMLRTEAIIVQLNVWQINGESNVLSINIPHPLGEWVEMWPPIDGWSEERKEAASRRVVPKLLSFGDDGQQLICETEAEIRTIYDSRTGRMLQHSNMSSVGLFKAMLMIAMHQVPAEVKSLTFEITPVEKAIRMERAADGWWRAGTNEKYGFKVDGEQFVSLIGGVEAKEHILMRLGLKDDTNLAEFSSFRHPLGVIKINRDANFSCAFGTILEGSGVEPVRLPPKSPNCNSHIERLHLSIKSECLDRMIFFGEKSLRNAVREYLAHYHGMRNHQGLENRIIDLGEEVGRCEGTIQCQENSEECYVTTIVTRPDK